MKKTLALLLALVVTVCSLSFAVAEAPVTLRFSWWGGDARHQATLEAIKLYECGPQRHAPMHFPRSKAVEQFGAHLLYADGIAQRYGMTLTIENIWDGDTNILYTFESCHALMKTLDRDHIRSMADFIHMRRQGEPLENILAAEDSLCHVHMGNSYTAECPTDENEDDYLSFLMLLRRMNYRGNITIEAADLQNAGKTVSLMRKLLLKAGFDNDDAW